MGKTTIKTSASVKEAMAIKQTLASHRSRPNYNVLTKFASAEHLAHTVPYELASGHNPNEPVIIFDADGGVREYKVTKIQTKDAGICGFILTGKEADNNTVHVVFRGTADGASVRRDLEYGGAGQTSFNAEKALITSQILSKVADRSRATDKKVNVVISGHSLGGADAQNCANAILEEMADHYTHAHKDKQLAQLNPVSRINHLTINHVNSGGVSMQTANTSKHNAEIAAKHGVKINLCALKVAGDGIQQTGQTNIFSDVPDNVAHVEVLKVKSGTNGWLRYTYLTIAAAIMSKLSSVATVGLKDAYSTYKAHTQLNFSKELDNTRLEHFTNKDADGIKYVKKELRHKTFLDNNPLAHGVKKLLHTVFNRTKREKEIDERVALEHAVQSASKRALKSKLNGDR